ncbi:MAG TPA: class I SAM-dependent rRNA methyltransferase [Polyangia bacterium]|nr:class I SAM-dependent rRNA methyltransferase [Polyangia bacterium]
MRGGSSGLIPKSFGGSSSPVPGTGSPVAIIGTDGKFVARGLFDAKSPIAVRIATLDPREPLDESLVRTRLQRALRARRGVIDPATTTAFRWCNGEGDFLPGVVVDLYGPVAVLRLDGDAVRVWRDWVVATLVDDGRPLGITHVLERSRGGKVELLHGGAPPSPVEIREHDVRFAVDVLHGQKTGFFLDQRENRRAIRPFAAGVDAVNLFGYTGGFSVHAALAGARRVTTVDVAAAALTDARANFALNGLDPERHAFDAEDAFAWLDRAARERRRYGLVITDPPSFAPSEKALQKALTAYRDLHARALALVDEGGTFAAASCSSHVTMDAFVGTLRDASDKTRRPLRILELRGQPGDHPTPPAFPEGRYLKFVLARAD